MKMLLKVSVGFFAIVAAVLLAVALAVAFLFEPEDYRPLIVKAVEQSTGRSFDMRGELGLKLFPCCSVAVGPTTLGNPPGFGEEHFARLDAAEFSIEIWPLLTRREVKIGQVTLDGLDLTLVQLADGSNNWTFSEAPDQPPGSADGEAGLSELSIAGLRVRGSTLRYRDQSSGASYLLRDIDLETGRIASLDVSDLDFDLASSFTAVDEADGTTAVLSFNGALSLAGDQIGVSQLRVELDATGAAVPAQRVAGVIRAESLELRMVDPLSLKAGSLGAELRVEKLDELQADLTADARLATLEMDLDALTGRFSGLDAALAGLDSQVQVSGAGEFGRPTSTLQGGVEFKQVALRTLMQALDAGEITPADTQALQQLSGSARWVYGEDHVSLEDVALRLDDTQLTGSLGVRNFDTPAIRYDLVMDRIDADRYLPAPDAVNASAASEPTVIPLESLKGMNLDGKLRIEKLRASNLDLVDLQLTVSEKNNSVALSLSGRVAGGVVRIDGGGDVGQSDPQLSGGLTVENLSPRQLLDATENSVATADPAVLARLTGSSRWRLGSRAIAFEQMDWQLDQTKLSGAVTIDDFDALAARFELALDRLNLDGYLAPDDESAATAAGDAAEIPMEIIRDLQLEGRLTAGELVVSGLKLQNLSADVRARDGVLRLDPLQARLYGGDYRGAITIDATGPKAKLSLDQQLSSVQVAEILRGLYDSDRLAGSLSLQMTGAGAGNTATELLKALTGNVAMNLSDGVYRGMDIGYEVQRAQALLRKEAAPQTPSKMETPIRALSFAGQIANGVLGSDQLTAEIPFLRLAGKGGINLIELALDYQLNAQVLKKDDTTTGNNLADLVNATIPLTIKGPLASPKVSVDMKNLVTNAVRDTVQERAREAVLKRLGGGSPQTSPPVQPSAPAATAPATATPAADISTAMDSAESAATAPVDESAALQAAPAEAATPDPAPAEASPAPEKPKSDKPKDLLKRGLQDLLKPKPPAEPVQ